MYYKYSGRTRIQQKMFIYWEFASMWSANAFSIAFNRKAGYWLMASNSFVLFGIECCNLLEVVSICFCFGVVLVFTVERSMKEVYNSINEYDTLLGVLNWGFCWKRLVTGHFGTTKGTLKLERGNSNSVGGVVVEYGIKYTIVIIGEFQQQRLDYFLNEILWLSLEV